MEVFHRHHWVSRPSESWHFAVKRTLVLSRGYPRFCCASEPKTLFIHMCVHKVVANEPCQGYNNFTQPVMHELITHKHLWWVRAKRRKKLHFWDIFVMFQLILSTNVVHQNTKVSVGLIGTKENLLRAVSHLPLHPTLRTLLVQYSFLHVTYGF